MKIARRIYLRYERAFHVPAVTCWGTKDVPVNDVEGTSEFFRLVLLGVALPCTLGRHDISNYDLEPGGGCERSNRVGWRKGGGREAWKGKGGGVGCRTWMVRILWRGIRLRMVVCRPNVFPEEARKAPWTRNHRSGTQRHEAKGNP